MELLTELGVAVRGVEPDPQLVTSARGRGLDVEQGFAVEYLRSVEPGSLGGIVMIQVIEHLSPQHVIDFVALAAEKLRPGGKVVLETVNPASLYTYARAFWVDPDHVRPVHPSFLEFLFREAEFSKLAIEYRSPVSESRATRAAAGRRSADAACSTRTSNASERCSSAPRTTPSSPRDDGRRPTHEHRASVRRFGRRPPRAPRRGCRTSGRFRTRRVRHPSDPRRRVAGRRDHERRARVPRRVAPGRAVRSVRRGTSRPSSAGEVRPLSEFARERFARAARVPRLDRRAHGVGVPAVAARADRARVPQHHAGEVLRRHRRHVRGAARARPVGARVDPPPRGARRSRRRTSTRPSSRRSATKTCG